MNPNYSIQQQPFTNNQTPHVIPASRPFIVIDDLKQPQSSSAAFSSHVSRMAENSRQKEFGSNKPLTKSKSMAILGGTSERAGNGLPNAKKFCTVVHVLRAHYKERHVGSHDLCEKVYIK